jgi:hypothetical protein
MLPPSTIQEFCDFSAAHNRIVESINFIKNNLASNGCSHNIEHKPLQILEVFGDANFKKFHNLDHQPKFRQFVDIILPNGGGLYVGQRRNIRHPGQHDHLHRYYFGSKGYGDNKAYVFRLYDDERRWVKRKYPENARIHNYSLSYNALGKYEDLQSSRLDGCCSPYTSLSYLHRSGIPYTDNRIHSYFSLYFERPEWEFRNGNPLISAEVTYDGETVEPFDKLTLLKAMQETLGAKLPPLMLDYMDRLGRAKTAETLEDLRALNLPTADFDRAVQLRGMTNSL